MFTTKNLKSQDSFIEKFDIEENKVTEPSKYFKEDLEIDDKIKNKSSHNQLKEVGKKYLIGLGFDPSQIFFEYKVHVGSQLSEKYFLVDVAGISPSNKVAIECGHITDETKMPILSVLFDKVLMLPYNSDIITTEQTEKLIKKQDEMRILREENKKLKTELTNFRDTLSNFNVDIKNMYKLRRTLRLIYLAFGLDSNQLISMDRYLDDNKSRIIYDFIEKVESMSGNNSDVEEKTRKLQVEVLEAINKLGVEETSEIHNFFKR